MPRPFAKEYRTPWPWKNILEIFFWIFGTLVLKKYSLDPPPRYYFPLWRLFPSVSTLIHPHPLSFGNLLQDLQYLEARCVARSCQFASTYLLQNAIAILQFRLWKRLQYVSLGSGALPCIAIWSVSCEGLKRFTERGEMSPFSCLLHCMQWDMCGNILASLLGGSLLVWMLVAVCWFEMLSGSLLVWMFWVAVCWLKCWVAVCWLEMLGGSFLVWNVGWQFVG